MAEDLTHLVHEVERVVTASYVPSLQDLYGVVQHCAIPTITSWALQKPCQVGSLADILVESLSRSRVALPLLASFVSSPKFRDVLLDRQPVILDTFLEKAVDAGESEASIYHPACVALLSSPLPLDLVPPSRLSGFITRLVSIMAARPCAETVAPLHTLMRSLGCSSRIFNEVPTEVMSNLQSEFTKTLRNLDDHRGSLLCLSAFATLATSGKTNPRHQHGPVSPLWLLNIQNFFGPKRGMKTLDLVVLRVIFACSANCNNLTPAQAAESIRLAIDITDAIGPAQRDSWVTGNSSKIAKLCEKVARDGLDREIQVTGVAFLLSLRPVTALPTQIRDLGLRILVFKDSQSAFINMSPHLVSRLTSSIARCDESIIYELLRFIVDTVKDDNPSRGSLSNLQAAEAFLSSFETTQSQPVITSLLNSASMRQTIASLLGRFPTKPNQTQCAGSDVCYFAHSTLKNKVLLALFEIYFASALAQNGTNTDIVVMKTFVDRVATFHTEQQCSFSESNTGSFRGSWSVRNRQEFVSNQHPNRDWRSRVAESLLQNAQASHANMMNMVGEVCFDLERRCYDVEAPLRSVEAERDGHLAEAQQLKCQNEGLERQIGESTNTISALRQELAQVEEQAEATSTRAEELSMSLDAARHDLHQQQRLSEQTLQEEREKARTRELDLIAASTAKDDQLEDLQNEVLCLQKENEKMCQSFDVASKDRATSVEAVASLQNELGEVKSLLESEKAMCAQKEDEVKRLLTDNEDIRLEMGILKTMTEEQNVAVERLHSALQEAEEKQNYETRLLTSKHEVETAQAASEITKQKEEIARLHTAMEVAAREYNKKYQSKANHIQQLEGKIQSLLDERAMKAREFSEAQKHIGRLMGVMGFTAKPVEPAISNRQHRAHSTELAQSNQRRHSENYDDDNSQLAETFATLRPNLQGPSPKRPKGNRRFPDVSQIPPPKTPGPAIQRSNAAPPTISRERIVRQPLTETDSNSPVKSQVVNTPKVNQIGAASPEQVGDHPQNFDLDMDLEFSKDFIFTSTAFSGSNDELAPQ